MKKVIQILGKKANIEEFLRVLEAVAEDFGIQIIFKK